MKCKVTSFNLFVWSWLLGGSTNTSELERLCREDFSEASFSAKQQMLNYSWESTINDGLGSSVGYNSSITIIIFDIIIHYSGGSDVTLFNDMQ